MMMAVLGCMSCGEEEYYSSSFLYMLSCSKDLLKFATPVVTYFDGDGVERTYTLKESDWKEPDGFSMVIGKDKVEVSEPDSYYWTKEVRFDSFGVRSWMKVKFVLKENVNVTDNYIYNFNYSLECFAFANSSDISNSSRLGSAPKNYKQVEASQVVSYLQDFSNTIEEVTLSVDSDGQIQL